MNVSILIPCYNAARWVGVAIESAIGQTHRDKEVIVVDDGSTDGSLEIIKSFGNRIRWESGPNRGGNVARNRLLEMARADWLQYLDADDCLLPEKVERFVEFVSDKPDVDIVFGPMIIEHWSEHNSVRQVIPIPKPHDPYVLLARWYLPQTGAVLWRKQAIVDVGGWKPDQPCCQENELYLRLLMAGKRFAYCAAPGAVYRQWGEHTVCKRDKAEVRTRRLAIEDAVETFLNDRKELTQERQRAVNQARFEIARLAWNSDRAEARRIVEKIRGSQPDFVPSGAAAPPHYRATFRLLGFRWTETLAQWRRVLSSVRPPAMATSSETGRNC
jgi:glycosyltransferase involved in cell wall biosynthesis